MFAQQKRIIYLVNLSLSPIMLFFTHFRVKFKHANSITLNAPQKVTFRPELKGNT